MLVCSLLASCFCFVLASFILYLECFIKNRIGFHLLFALPFKYMRYLYIYIYCRQTHCILCDCTHIVQKRHPVDNVSSRWSVTPSPQCLPTTSHTRITYTYSSSCLLRLPARISSIATNFILIPTFICAHVACLHACVCMRLACLHAPGARTRACWRTQIP